MKKRFLFLGLTVVPVLAYAAGFDGRGFPGGGGGSGGAATGFPIGGTITGGTPGSVLFVGPGPVLAQDNANFYWDDTNDRIGFGTNAPITTVHLARTDPGPAQYFSRLTLSAAPTVNSFSDVNVQTFQSAGALINLAVLRAYADGFPGLATYSNQNADGAAQLILRAGNISSGRVLLTFVNNSGNPPQVVFSNGNAGKSAYDEFMVVEAFGQTKMGASTVGFGGTSARLTVNNNVVGEDPMAIGQSNVETARFKADGSLLFQQNGTAAAPIIALGNDTNTGILHPAADQIAISANSSTIQTWTGTQTKVTSDPSASTTAASSLLVDLPVGAAAGDYAVAARYNSANDLFTVNRSGEVDFASLRGTRAADWNVAIRNDSATGVSGFTFTSSAGSANVGAIGFRNASASLPGMAIQAASGAVIQMIHGSSNTVNFRPGDGTNPTIEVNTLATAATLEILQTWAVSDSSAKCGIVNTTSSNSAFLPLISCYVPTGGGTNGARFDAAALNATEDTGSSAVWVQRVARGTAFNALTAAITTRPLISWQNYTTEIELLFVNGRHAHLRVAPTALSADQDNYASCTGYAVCFVSASGADRTITGFTKNSGNTSMAEEFTLCNAGSANNIILAHDVTSTAANRMYLSGSANKTVVPYSCVKLLYNDDLDRWQLSAGPT